MTAAVARGKVRVLVIDDSAVARETVARALARDPGIEVVGTALDPIFAERKIREMNPDVLTLDLELPRMDGLSFLRSLMARQPLPVVVVSSFTTTASSDSAVRALELGAVDVVGKPGASCPPDEFALELAAKVKAAARVSRRAAAAAAPGATAPAAPSSSAAPRSAALAGAGQALVAIGASTGGTSAIAAIVGALPADAPPVVVVQHMPPLFTTSFAARLNQGASVEVREAAQGDVLRPGLVLIAPGGRHLVVRGSGARLVADVKDGPLVRGHRPSVDVLFHSVARTARASAVGVLLTGMGDDGADGLCALRKAGARTIAQDESTSIVFGMPREAIERGGAELVLPLPSIAARAVELARLAGLGGRVGAG